MQIQSTQPGVIQYANVGAAIAVGAVIDLAHRAGIAIVDIAATTGIGSVAVAGCFVKAKDTSTIALGDVVYWDVSESKVSTTQGAGDPRLGIAVRAAATGDAYCHFELNAPRTVGATTIASGAGDAAANAAAIITIIGLLQQAGIAKKP